MTIWGCPTPPRASSTPAPPQILGRPHTLLTLAPRQAVMLSRHACRKQATLCRAGAVVGRQLGVCHLGSAVLHARARAELMIDQVGSAPSHLAATEALACRWWCVAEPVCHADRPGCCAVHWTGASTGAGRSRALHHACSRPCMRRRRWAPPRSATSFRDGLAPCVKPLGVVKGWKRDSGRALQTHLQQAVACRGLACMDPAHLCHSGAAW